MRSVMLVFGLIGTIGLMLVSVAMNVRFGQSLGATTLDGLVFGGVSASADLFKCFLPFLIIGAWQNRRIAAVFGGVVLWSVFTAYSLASSLGYSALSRAEVEAARGGPAQILATLHRRAGDVTRKLDAVAPGRKSLAIERDLSTARTHSRWRSTAGCTDATAKLSIAFCADVGRLQVELRARHRRDELSRERETLIAKANALRSRGVMTDTDP